MTTAQEALDEWAIWELIAHYVNYRKQVSPALWNLLPETDFFGAMMFSRRAMATVREEAEVQEIEAQLPLSLVWGASTFPRDGEDMAVGHGVDIVVEEMVGVGEFPVPEELAVP